MKELIVSCLLSFGLFAGAQTGFKMPEKINFERSIVQKINHDDKSTELTYYFSSDGNYAALKPEEKKQGSLIIYTKEGKMLIVSEKEKMIMVMDLNSMIGGAAQMAEKMKNSNLAKDSAGSKKGSFAKTGKTKTICNYPAEEFEGKTEKGVTSIWMMKTDFDTRMFHAIGMNKMGSNPRLPNSGNDGKSFPGIDMTDQHYFMAEMATDGKKIMETISVNKSDFNFSSAGYTVRDMSDLIKGKIN